MENYLIWEVIITGVALITGLMGTVIYKAKIQNEKESNKEIFEDHYAFDGMCTGTIIGSIIATLSQHSIAALVLGGLIIGGVIGLFVLKKEKESDEKWI